MYRYLVKFGGYMKLVLIGLISMFLINNSYSRCSEFSANKLIREAFQSSQEDKVREGIIDKDMIYSLSDEEIEKIITSNVKAKDPNSSFNELQMPAMQPFRHAVMGICELGCYELSYNYEENEKKCNALYSDLIKNQSQNLLRVIKKEKEIAGADSKLFKYETGDFFSERFFEKYARDYYGAKDGITQGPCKPSSSGYSRVIVSPMLVHQNYNGCKAPDFAMCRVTVECDDFLYDDFNKENRQEAVHVMPADTYKFSCAVEASEECPTDPMDCGKSKTLEKWQEDYRNQGFQMQEINSDSNEQ